MKNLLTLSVVFFISLPVNVFCQSETVITPSGKTLTIYNKSDKGCYFWFAGYTDATGKAKKKWHPSYSEERKTVTPLIIYPGQVAEVALTSDECFWWMYAWWGPSFAKANKKISKNDRCSTITLNLTKNSKGKLILDYEVAQTSDDSESDTSEDDSSTSEEDESTDETTSEETNAEDSEVKKKGYWV